MIMLVSLRPKWHELVGNRHI